MLEQLSRRSLIDIPCAPRATLHRLPHTTGDSGIVLGECLAKALGDRAGIRRYGAAHIPMDETLTEVALDVSNRPLSSVWKGVCKAQARHHGHRAFRNGSRPSLNWAASPCKSGTTTARTTTISSKAACWSRLALMHGGRDRPTASLDAQHRGRALTKPIRFWVLRDSRHRRLRLRQLAVRRESLRTRRPRGRPGRPRAGDRRPARRRRCRSHRSAGCRRMPTAARRSHGVPGWSTLQREIVERGKPFLGICVGMQLMATRGVGTVSMPGWTGSTATWCASTKRGSGTTVLKIPHMGWKAVRPAPHALLVGIAPHDHACFVHSLPARGPPQRDRAGADRLRRSDHGHGRP